MSPDFKNYEIWNQKPLLESEVKKLKSWSSEIERRKKLGLSNTITHHSE